MTNITESVRPTHERTGTVRGTNTRFTDRRGTRPAGTRRTFSGFR